MSNFESKKLHLLGTGLLLAAAPALCQAAYRCDVPQVGPDAQACAIAKQGPDELRRFIQRTRAAYGLYYYDYVRP